MKLALYDTVDGMPRLYAQIKEVFVSGFNVSVTWLKPNSYDEEPIQRYEKDLHVSVGRFKFGKDEITQGFLTWFIAIKEVAQVNSVYTHEKGRHGLSSRVATSLSYIKISEYFKSFFCREIPTANGILLSIYWMTPLIVVAFSRPTCN